MDKINWKQKLSSRKLWLAVFAAVVTILTALFKTELTAETIALIEKGVLALCVYIGGESVVDAARQIWSIATATEVLEETLPEETSEETVYEEE